MRIGTVDIPSQLVLAPMAGVTDLAFRLICRELGAGLTVTEMVSAKAPARRGRPPLAPELYVEFSGKQYNVTDIIDRAKADYRATHKVGVQSCKVYVKPEEDAAYYVINKVSGKLEL